MRSSIHAGFEATDGRLTEAALPSLPEVVTVESVVLLEDYNR